MLPYIKINNIKISFNRTKEEKLAYSICKIKSEIIDIKYKGATWNIDVKTGESTCNLRKLSKEEESEINELELQLKKLEVERKKIEIEKDFKDKGVENE